MSEYIVKEYKEGCLRIAKEVIESQHTTSVGMFGYAMLSGNLIPFGELLNEHAEVTIYGDRTISGKNNVLEYWNAWRERWVLTGTITDFEVVHSNYYFKACLQMRTMLVLFVMNDDEVLKMVLVRRHISRYLSSVVSLYPS